MQGDLIEAFSTQEFQDKLLLRWSQAGDDMVMQAKARQEVCLEVQGPIIAKYGFEASRKGVAMSVLAFRTPELETDGEIMERNHLLGYLADPSKRGEELKVATRRSGRQLQANAPQETQSGAPKKRVPAVDLSVHSSTFEGVVVPARCTVRAWKQLLLDGYFGEKVLFAERLRCHAEECSSDGLRQALGRRLQDKDLLPQPPNRMCVVGATSILNVLELSLQKRVGATERLPRLGDYRMGDGFGSGFAGVCIYKAEHVRDGTQAAIKWPAKPEEVEALQEIDKRAPIGCLGIPYLLGSGMHKEQPYIVMERFGDRLSTIFPKPFKHSMDARWNAMRVIGRMMVRRFENLHRIGYVHGDVSPENILLGRGRGEDSGQAALYLVDFGLARPFPGGGRMGCDKGSAEWSSIRSAEGLERRPEDDLEALGWVLLHGLFGGLPWIEVLTTAYGEGWATSPDLRLATLKRVQRMKSQLLGYICTGCVTEGSWELAGSDWKRFIETPRELGKFLMLCQKPAVPPSRPDYATMLSLLGNSGELTPWGAEQEDCRQYEEHVLTLV